MNGAAIREAWRKVQGRDIPSLMLLGILVFGAGWGGLALTHFTGRTSALWLPHALLVVAALKTPRRPSAAVFLVGLVGMAAGAVAGRAEIAFVSSTDLPFLHPAFVRRVLRAVQAGADVGLPLARGYPQPLAAAYRTTLAPAAQRLVAAGRLRLTCLLTGCLVARLDEAALRADPVLAALDPGLDSVVNVNSPADYRQARARPAPEVTIQRSGLLAEGHRGPQVVRAATVARAAAAAGLALTGHVVAALNEDQITSDGQTPLVTGDTVCFLSADAVAGADGGRIVGRGHGS